MEDKQRTYGDHPRRCGENYRPLKEALQNFGSPPQVRGKLNRWTKLHKETGITPAGAGKTTRTITEVQHEQDHPRRCGENCLGALVPAVCTGSPPQVRGKPVRVQQVCNKIRITPAGAGKTWVFGFLWRARWDHPRRCGENRCRAIGTPPNRGSPPQVRGKRKSVRCRSAADRITPAGAGKTLYLHRQQNLRKDHPRRCGENFATCGHTRLV